MSVRVPTPLLSLPDPWGRLDKDCRDVLGGTDQELENGLQVLARCFDGLAFLPKDPPQLTEELDEHWGMLATGLSCQMETFDEFRLDAIRTLVSEGGRLDVTDELVDNAAVAWFHSAATSLAVRVLYWLEDRVRERADDTYQVRLWDLLVSNWKRVGDDMAYSSLSTLRLLDEARGKRIIAAALDDHQVADSLKSRIRDLA